MRRLLLLIGLCFFGGAANAYDARLGDTLVELRLSPSEQGLSFGQFLSPQVPVSVVAALSLSDGHGGASVGALGMRVGYEWHQRGYAIVPRSSVELGMGFDRAQGVGALIGGRGGVVWYVIRAAGLGFDLGIHRRVGLFRVDAAISLVARF